ncbi:hypothetical protein BU16DRAFT_523989 [Lophium mytilinum]|uniref:Uncharacterized protein n=1 Tax=Lophium mytilinum TaxID=390894 RepID=A0A6A6R430_9PEZI|nr:hypothetical protein BU16DRAFT_523989 [Lophium mytilinum]
MHWNSDGRTIASLLAIDPSPIYVFASLTRLPSISMFHLFHSSYTSQEHRTAPAQTIHCYHPAITSITHPTGPPAS